MPNKSALFINGGVAEHDIAFRLSEAADVTFTFAPERLMTASRKTS